MGGPLAMALLGTVIMHLSTNEARQSFQSERLEVITYLSFLSLRESDIQLTLYRNNHPERRHVGPISSYTYDTSISVTWIDHRTAEVGLIHFVPTKPDTTHVDILEQSAMWSYRGTNDHFLWHKSGGLDTFAADGRPADSKNIQ
ncbi:MAG: hypothetical protein ACREBW_01825, partial [Candidatus Micrarchaeaceae archaeon]